MDWRSFAQSGQIQNGSKFVAVDFTRGLDGLMALRKSSSASGESFQQISQLQGGKYAPVMR